MVSSLQIPATSPAVLAGQMLGPPVTYQGGSAKVVLPNSLGFASGNPVVQPMAATAFDAVKFSPLLRPSPSAGSRPTTVTYALPSQPVAVQSSKSTPQLLRPPPVAVPGSPPAGPTAPRTFVSLQGKPSQAEDGGGPAARPWSSCKEVAAPAARSDAAAPAIPVAQTQKTVKKVAIRRKGLCC
eukprot:TRINITY_DN28905_c0_g1_i2.p1 TRINITY_DN28905_c0_g1~~TRINITY_DN28905_c0_g1_i2.p1  ORF type:complete len:183 (+),score=24.35 TRINITY_DN28905_c0_g1_i2:118-666(+)